MRPSVVTTAELHVTELVAGLTGDVDVIGLFLLGFAVVALVVATLVIANTFGIVIAQRTRELALLRCVGAGRSQLFGSVVAQALTWASWPAQLACSRASGCRLRCSRSARVTTCRTRSAASRSRVPRWSRRSSPGSWLPWSRRPPGLSGDQGRAGRSTRTGAVGAGAVSRRSGSAGARARGARPRRRRC